jgi:hypothetical protein
MDLLALRMNRSPLIPGGVIDADHATAKHPLLANATAELQEEFGMNLADGVYRFSCWIVTAR